MRSCTQIIQAIKAGAYDELFTLLYVPDGNPDKLELARKRAIHVTQSFQERFDPSDNVQAALFSGPGRTEIGGNHTDHQNGHVLCASVDLDMLACAAPNGLSVVRIVSEGYPALEVDLNSLVTPPEERNTSAALVRGVAAMIDSLGYSLSGFDAYVVSNVLSGSGLSSSAAYEILIGNIFNSFSCRGLLNAITLAKIGQFAENNHFGKPCGLMDQMGSSVGGAVTIDFADPNAPVVEQIDYDFAKSGHVLCIIDTGSCHADLTDDYATIPQEMNSIAACFGRKHLREVPENDFRMALTNLRSRCGDRAVLRAMHYYEDDKRVLQEVEALKASNFQQFLDLVNQSGLSSSLKLQNTWSIADPKSQAIPIVLTVGQELLGGSGAIRVHGGGFAGTVQAFVPLEKLDHFKEGMEALLGPGMCHVLHIRPRGGCIIDP